MNRHSLNPYILLRPVLLVDLDGLDFGQRCEALVAEQLAKHGVHAVEVGRGRKGNKELAAVGVGALICHAEHAALVVPQPRADLVVKGRPVDGPPALGVVWRVGLCGRAGLRHEGGDEAVEGGVVVVGGCAEGKEVLWTWGVGQGDFKVGWGSRCRGSFVPRQFWGRSRRRLRF